MNTVTYFLVFTMSGFLVYYLFMLAVRVRRNYLNGIGFRETLFSQISSMRMGRMMDALEINKERYLHQESVLDIDSHINSCNECKNTNECDEKLNSKNIDPENISFCNNEESLLAISRKHDDKPKIN